MCTKRSCYRFTKTSAELESGHTQLVAGEFYLHIVLVETKIAALKRTVDLNPKNSHIILHETV